MEINIIFRDQSDGVRLEGQSFNPHHAINEIRAHPRENGSPITAAEGHGK